MDPKIFFPVVLNGSNYLVWSRTARTALKGRGLWSTHVEAPFVWVGHGEFPTNRGETKWFRDQVVLRSTHEEAPFVEGACDGDVFSTTHAAKGEVNVGEFSTSLEVVTVCVGEFPSNLEEAKWLREDQVVLEALRGSLDPVVCAVHSRWRTAKEIWDGLEDMFLGCSLLNRKVEIKKELAHLQEGESLCSRLEGKKRSLLAELADLEALSHWSKGDQLVELIIKLNNPYVEPMYVLRVGVASGDVHVVDTKKGEVVLSLRNESLEEESVVFMNQGEDSCVVEVGQEAGQPKDVTDQEEDSSDEAPLMECSWEEDDWGHVDPWNETLFEMEDVCSTVGEMCHEEDKKAEVVSQLKILEDKGEHNQEKPSDDPISKDSDGMSHETPYLQKKDEDGDHVYEDYGKPSSEREDRGNVPTREEGGQGNLTPTREGEGVEEGHESLDQFKLGGCYLNQPSLRGSVEIWETPWLIREGGSQEEEAPKLKEESEVISEPKKCSKSMCESNHAKLDLCDQRGSSLRVSVKTPHKDSKEGGQVTWSMDMTKEPKPNASKPKEDLGCVSESYHFKYGLCDPRRPYLRGSVEMTHIKPKEDVLGSQDEGDSLGTKVHDHEGRGPKEDDRGPKLGARVTIDDRGPKDGSKLILDGRGCMVGGLRSKETSQGISNLGQDGLRLKMKEPRWQSCHRGRPRNCGRSPSRLRKQGKRPRWTRTLGRRLNHQGRPRNKGEGRAILAGLEELANRLSGRSCGSDNDKCPRHLTEHKEMWLGQPRQVLKLKHSKDQQPRRKGSTKHVTKWLHHMNRYGSRKEAPRF